MISNGCSLPDIASLADAAAEATASASKLGSILAWPPKNTKPRSVVNAYSPISSRFSRVMIGWPGGMSSSEKSFAPLEKLSYLRMSKNELLGVTDNSTKTLTTASFFILLAS